MATTQTETEDAAASQSRVNRPGTEVSPEGKEATPRAAITLNYASKESLYMSFMPFLVRGGFFIPTDRLFRNGDALRLKVVLPGAKEPIQVSARVVWQTPKNAAHGGPQGIGLHLDDLPVCFKLRGQVESLLMGMKTSRMTYTL